MRGWNDELGAISPVDRPWGMRTAAFADPSGHIWEVAQPLQASGR